MTKEQRKLIQETVDLLQKAQTDPDLNFAHYAEQLEKEFLAGTRKKKIVHYSVGYDIQLPYGKSHIIVRHLNASNLDFVNEWVRDLQPEYEQKLRAIGVGWHDEYY